MHSPESFAEPRIPCAIALAEPQTPPDPDRAPTDNDGDEAPETPPTEPKPAPVKEPPDSPGKRRGPYVVEPAGG